MDRVPAGYTVVEVLIVLTITSLLFFSAVSIFSSQRGSTEYSQAMQDLNSQVAEYANQVSSSTYTGSEGYKCTIGSGSRATLQAVATPTPGSDCIFLGRAILALPNSDHLSVYTVLGNKDIWTAGSDTGNLATTIDTARPEVAIAQGGGTASFVLNETYQLGAGATVRSATLSGGGGPYDLLGMYNGLTNDAVASSSGTNALVLYGYPCNNSSCDTPTPSSGQLQSCIEESGICTGFTRLLARTWNLCIQDRRGANPALLAVTSSPGGITTRLNFDGCS